MNKNRLEALSDGVFSIAMTILVFGFAVPKFGFPPSEVQLAAEIAKLGSVFTSYFISFAVLAMFWISHNFFYGSFTRTINRTLVLLNMIYLAFIALLPFSAGLLGEYVWYKAAIITYGLNVLAIGVVASVVLRYAIISDEIDTSHVEPRLLHQARVRSLLTPVCTMIGLCCAFFSLPLALFWYAFPIVFNIVPGLLDLTERVFGFRL